MPASGPATPVPPMNRPLLVLAALATLTACGDPDSPSEPVAFSDGEGGGAVAATPDPFTFAPPPTVGGAPAVAGSQGSQGNQGNQGNQGGGATDGAGDGAPSDPGAPVPDPSVPPVLTADGHVALVAAVLDVYRGAAYRGRLLDATSGAAPAELGFGDAAAGVTPEAPTLDVACANGGTAGFELVRERGREGWNTTFGGCQDGSDVLDGRVARVLANGGATLELDATGFGVEGQDGAALAFDGTVRRLVDEGSPRTERAWSARGMNLADTASGTATTLSDANYRYWTTENAGGNVVRAELDGGFAMSSPLTGGAELAVQTPEALRFRDRSNTPEARGDGWTFEAGALRIIAADGSTLLLQAANGDRDTVDVTITGGGETITLVQPWSTWRENLRMMR